MPAEALTTLGALSFKESLENDRGLWINIWEINYLISKGIITVDEAALKTYRANEDEVFSAACTIEETLEDYVGYPLDDDDKQVYDAVIGMLVSGASCSTNTTTIPCKKE